MGQHFPALGTLPFSPMRKNLSILLASLLCAPLLWAQDDLRTLTHQLATEEARSAARFFDAAGGQGDFTHVSDNYDVRHYRLHFRIDPAIRYIAGDVTVSFNMKAPSSTIILDLVDSLLVDSVRHRETLVPFRRPGDQSLVIDLPSTIEQGAVDSLTVYYQGVPPFGNGYGSFATSTQGGTPVMWTLSEPYGSRDWWPCKNGLGDKADSIDVIITTPVAYRSVSNGLLHREDSTAESRTTWWTHKYPIASYLVAIASTNYVVTTDTVQLQGAVMPLMQHCYPGNEDYFRAAFGFTKNALRWFTEYFGPYPFIRERYGHTQFSKGGGMEHQTNSFMYNLAGGTILHEMAHQWFGDKITCGSWQHIWLNEGFATYGTYLGYEHIYPPDFNTGLRHKLVDAITAKPGGSVFVEDTTSVARIFDSRLSYNKGSMLLRMLRGIMGDDKFFSALKAYMNDPDLAYRHAVTADLQRHLERAAGIELDEFFKDWFYGQGYPSYQLAWRPVGGQWVMLDLSQTTSDPSVPFFEMPVPIRFSAGTRSKTVVIDHQRNGQRAYVDIGFAPDSVEIDPEVWLISANNTIQRMPDDAPGSPEIRAFPNPAGAQLQVWLRRIPDGPTSMVLHDALGRMVWSRAWTVTNGGDYSIVPMDGLARGVYWIAVRQGNKRLAVKKIMK